MARIVFIFKGKAKELKKALASEPNWSECSTKHDIKHLQNKIIAPAEAKINVF